MAYFLRVFRIDKKRELTRPRVLHARDACDLQFAVAFKAATQRIGDLAKSHGTKFQRTAGAGRIGPRSAVADGGRRNRYQVCNICAEALAENGVLFYCKP